MSSSVEIVAAAVTPVYYIAGPMTGYAEYNFPAFYEMEGMLAQMGYGSVNPARLDDAGLPDGVDHEDIENGNSGDWRHLFLLRDFREVVYCDGIVLLPGWEASIGANCELALARMTGMEVIEVEASEVSGRDAFKFMPLTNALPDWVLIEEYITDLFVRMNREMQNDVAAV